MKKHNSYMKKIIITLSFIATILIIISLIYIINNPKIPVLCYHNIGTEEEMQKFPEEKEWTISVENFEEQLKYLNKYKYKTLTLEEFCNWKQGKIKLPYKSVLITFDDGFLSNYEYAFPLLEKYNMNATVFLIGNYMEEKNEEWNGNLKSYISKETLEYAKEKYKNIDFASHSYGLHEHGMIDIKTYEELVQDTKKFREEIIETDVYCYPFGAFNTNMINALKECNYKIAFIFGPTKKEYRKSSQKDDNYLIPRLNVSYGMEPKKLLLRLMIPF